MASTYTTNNGLEKPGIFEQEDAWGTTANTTYDLLDEALDGQVTVTLAATGSSGAPNTLPISNGSSSNGRNRYVEFNDGGDLGGTAYVQLTPNDAEKLIYVKNSLSGSRSILLFQGTYSSSNDYELANGDTQLLKFSGTGAGATVTVVAVYPVGLADKDAVDIGGGAIDGTPIGASSASTGAFTNVTASGTFDVTGNSTFGGTVGVTGAATLSSNLSVGGTLGVTGASTLTGNTTVGGTFGVTGAATLSSTLGVTGNTTLSGNASVAGTTSLNDAVTITGAVGVTGAVTATSTVTGSNTDRDFLSRETVTGVSSWEFTSVDSSKYDRYEIEIDNYVPTLDGTVLLGRVTTDGGSNWIGGASDYARVVYHKYGSSGSEDNSGSDGSAMQICRRMSNASVIGMSGKLIVYNMHESSLQTTIEARGSYRDNVGPDDGLFMSTNRYRTASATNGVQLFVTAGTLEFTVRVYGIRKNT